MSQWVGEGGVSERVNKWVSKWVSESMRDWTSYWVSERASEWMSECELSWHRTDIGFCLFFKKKWTTHSVLQNCYEA